MNISEANRAKNRKRIYWFLAVFISILVIKYGSKYVYLYMHDKECLAHYLKQNNFTQKIENIDPYKGSESLCYKFVQHIEEFTLKKKIKDLQDGEMDKKLAECMSNRIENNNSNIMLDVGYQVLLLTLKNGKKEFTYKELEHHNRLIDSASKMEQLKLYVFLYDCHIEKWSETTFEILCLAAYKAIVPSQIFSVNKCFAEYLKKSNEYLKHAEIYLKLPEVPASTCQNDVIAPLRDYIKDEFYQKTSIQFFKDYPKFRECFMQKADDLQIIDKMLVISMVGKLGMDEHTEKAEFKIYTEILEHFKRSLYNDCLKNEYF